MLSVQNDVLLLAIIILLIGSCQPTLEEESERHGPDLSNEQAYWEESALATYDISLLEAKPTEDKSGVPAGSVLTSHFQSWLSSNGYGAYDFARTDILGGSYGGKTTGATPVTKQPVIFIHGNSDKAVGTQFGQSGWTESLNYFLNQGYTQAELYAFTWGDADASSAANNYHSREFVMHVRKFVEAVLAYTGASKVDIVCHSMGVTLSRKAVKGGWAYDPNDGGSYYLGGSLSSSVDTFVGIAGGNQGLVNCYYSSSLPTCDDTNGFYPGYLWGWYGPYGVSDYIDDLNASSAYEGAYRYSIWSSADQIVGYACLVYGVNTCRLPSQTAEKSYSSAPYGHFNVKDLTTAVQYQMVVNHTVL